jgi:hypothetical protein
VSGVRQIEVETLRHAVALRELQDLRMFAA